MAQAVAITRPYADLIQSTHGESKSWLVNFLRKGYNIRHWEPRNPYIDIYILDTTDGTMSCQHFRPHRSDEADALFLTALGARPSNSKTRLVLVQVGHLGDMNPAYLDAIGWCYRLDPHFFSTILQDALYLSEGERFGGLARLPVTLPSENGHITVATDTLGSFANAAIMKSDGLNTIVLLGLDHSGNRIETLQRCLMDVTIFSKGGIVAADVNPCDFLLPYIRGSLKEIAERSRRHSHIQPKQRGHRQPSTFQWEWNQADYRNLLRTKSSISRFLERDYATSFQGKPQLVSVIQDYDFLIAETRENAAQLQGLLQNETSRQALMETKKSLEQADAVRRITIVGIVFIPLSFATSFFGMNFEQLGAGTLHIGFFFLLAAIAGLAAWALAASIEPTERLWTRARNRLGEREYPFLDDYTWVTKTMIVWSWMCRKSLLARTMDRLWQEEKGNLMDEKNEGFEERIPHFKRIMIWRTLLSIIRRLTLIYESHAVTLEYLKSKTKIWVLAMFLIGSQMDGLDLATES
ncbi:hypothetical protein MY4824_008657 [Beauveria thailandica]